MAGVPPAMPLVRTAETGGGERARLHRACEEFEGLFLAMLFREMRTTVPKDGLLSGGVSGEIMESMWADEVGFLSARSSPLKIADTLSSALSERAQGDLGVG